MMMSLIDDGPAVTDRHSDERLGSGPGGELLRPYRTASAARVTIESAGPARAKSLGPFDPSTDPARGTLTAA